MALGWCVRSGQVSGARLESTFLADDAACLTLVRAVIQLRCSEIVSLGCGLLSCVAGWCFLNGLWVSARVLFPQSHRVAHHVLTITGMFGIDEYIRLREGAPPGFLVRST